MAAFSASTSAGAGRPRGVGDGLHEVLEVDVVGDEVGLGVDLDQHGFAAGRLATPTAFGGHAVGLRSALAPDLRSASAAASMSPLVSLSALCTPSCRRRCARAVPDQGSGDFSHGDTFDVIGRAGAWPANVSRCSRHGRTACKRLRDVGVPFGLRRGVVGRGGLLWPVRGGRFLSPSAAKSSSRTLAADRVAALPSSTASAAAPAYSCTARMASSLPGMA